MNLPTTNQPTQWNGEPCDVRGLFYTVTKIDDTPLHWQNSKVGQTREGLEITQHGESWIIDNQHGDGWKKVTEGGTMWSGHKSVTNPENVEYFDGSKEINIMFNPVSIERETDQHDLWSSQHHPELFDRLVKMRESARCSMKDLEGMTANCKMDPPEPAGKYVHISGTNQKVWIKNN